MGNGAIIYNRLQPATTYETNPVSGYSADNALMDKPNTLCMTDSGNGQVGLRNGDLPTVWDGLAIAMINHTMESRNFSCKYGVDWNDAIAFTPGSFGNYWLALPYLSGQTRIDIYSYSHTNPWQVGEIYVGTKYDFPRNYMRGNADNTQTTQEKELINAQLSSSGNKVTSSNFELNFRDATYAQLQFFEALIYADNFVFIPDTDKPDECYYGNTLQSQIVSEETSDGWDFSFIFTQMGLDE